MITIKKNGFRNGDESQKTSAQFNRFQHNGMLQMLYVIEMNKKQSL